VRSYSCESDLVDLRVDMLVLLLRHGMRLDGADLAAALQDAPDTKRVISVAANLDGIDPGDSALLQTQAA
jgi:hypothetical protein